MKIVCAPRAVADLRSIYDYIRPRSTRGAKRIRADFLSSITQLVSFPRLGTVQTTAPVRKLVTRRYSYLIYYFVHVPMRQTVWRVVLGALFSTGITACSETCKNPVSEGQAVELSRSYFLLPALRN